jgi:hypothetical protein
MTHGRIAQKTSQPNFFLWQPGSAERHTPRGAGWKNETLPFNAKKMQEKRIARQASRSGSH